jgi:RNA polymerase sigma-70 factor (ECF subfamily)
LYRDPREDAATPKTAAHPPRPVDSNLDTLRDLLSTGCDALYRYIFYRIGADRSAAEDVLQQTVTVALGHTGLPNTREQQEGWLRGVAKNLIRRHWRLLKREPMMESDAIAGDGSSLVSATSDDLRPESVAIKRESIDQLMLAVSDLAADDQWLIYEFYRHGRTRSQIAQSLGTTEKSVQSRLYRLRLRLREKLDAPEGMLQ